MGNEISSTRETFRMPASQSSAKHHINRANSSNVDVRTGSILPMVNPLAVIPRGARSGQNVQVVFNQSHDFRGDVDHMVGYSIPETNANPRAMGALMDRQSLARNYPNRKVVPIPMVR
jgi:hypothetical protein